MLDQLSSELQRSLMNGDFSVPPYPAIAARLSQLISSDQFRQGTLCELVSKDQSLAAAVMKRANSAVFSGGKEINSLPRAVSRLGANELLRVAIRVGLASTVNVSGPLAGSRREAWRCGVLTAELAALLARGRGLDSGTAFLAGLLHDFGRVICVGWLEARAAAGAMPVAPPLRETFIDRNHVEVGMVVAHHWKLPAEVADVIARHHDSVGHTPLTQLVRLMDRVAALVESRPTVTAADLGSVTGVSERETQQLLEAIPSIVGSITELEVAAKHSKPSAVDTAMSTLGRRKRSVDFAVVCTAGKQIKGQATAMSYAGVRFETAVALPEQQLVRLRVDTAQPFEVLVNVTLCVSHEDRFLVEAKPYGLDGAAAQAWSALWGTAQAAAA